VKEHRYESFQTDSARFEDAVNDFIERRMSDEWVAKRCSYRTADDADPGKTAPDRTADSSATWISCMFERNASLIPF
jgi:hypothetical protein